MSGLISRVPARKMAEIASIQDRGGRPDGVTINTAAHLALRNAGYKTVRFPSGSANNYVFDDTLATAHTTGMVWDVDEGVTITINGNGYIDPNLRVTRPTRIYWGGLQREYWLMPERGHRSSKRPARLPHSDVDQTIVQPIYPNAGQLSFKKSAWPAGDVFTAYVPANTTADTVSITPPVDGNFYDSLYAARIGDEVTAQLAGVSDTQVMRAIVRTTQGYVGLTFDASANSTPSYFEKYKGQAVTTVNINYPGIGTHASYAAYYSLLTIRVNAKDNFSLLFNGVEVLGNRTVQGEIMEVGFGTYATGGAAALSFKDWTYSRYKKQGGKQPIRIAIFGDSRSAGTMQDVWPNWIRDYLEGWAGLRVHEITNYAVAGSSVADAAALCTEANIANADIIIIDSGTNDIQGATDETDYYNTLKGMIQTGIGQGKGVIVGVPDVFYSQAQAGAGVGQATQHYELGKGIRAKCIRLCADMGIKCVDKMQVLGPILANYMNPALPNSYAALGLDPVVYDSIHPDAYGHQLIAGAYAAAIAGMITARTTVVVEPALLDVANVANNWRSDLRSAEWSRDSTGRVWLSGWFNGGTRANGTLVYTLPENMFPRHDVSFVTVADGGTVTVTVAATGAITINALPAAANWFSLDGITFTTRLS